MDKNFYNIFFALFGFMLISRLQEIYLSRNNDKKLAKEFKLKLISPYEHYFIYVFHGLWFVMLISEVLVKKEIIYGIESYICYLLLALAQILRIESMKSLGHYWTMKIYYIPRNLISSGGIYHYFAHPSYLAVLLEFFALPYLFNAYWTLIIFFPLKLILLANRIRLEKLNTGRILL